MTLELLHIVVDAIGVISGIVLGIISLKHKTK